jgi:hypothetical protein
VAAVSLILIAESQDLGETYGRSVLVLMNNGGQNICVDRCMFMVG